MEGDPLEPPLCPALLVGTPNLHRGTGMHVKMSWQITLVLNDCLPSLAVLIYLTYTHLLIIIIIIIWSDLCMNHFSDSNNSGDNLYTMINTGPGNRSNVSLLLAPALSSHLLQSRCFLFLHRQMFLPVITFRVFSSFIMKLCCIPNPTIFSTWCPTFDLSLGGGLGRSSALCRE